MNLPTFGIVKATYEKFGFDPTVTFSKDFLNCSDKLYTTEDGSAYWELLLDEEEVIAEFFSFIHNGTRDVRMNIRIEIETNGNVTGIELSNDKSFNTTKEVFTSFGLDLGSNLPCMKVLIRFEDVDIKTF